MHIHFIRSNHFPNHGPATQRMQPFVEELLRRGNSVTITSASGSSILSKPDDCESNIFVKSQGIEQHGNIADRIIQKIAPAFPNIGLSTSQARKIKYLAIKAAKRQRPDLVITTVPPWQSAGLALLISRLADAPLLIDIRDLPDEHDPNRTRFTARQQSKYLTKYLKKANSLVVATSGFALDLKERYGINKAIHVVTNGYNPSLVKFQDAVAHDTFRISYFGILYPQRRFDVLLNAIRQLTTNNLINSDLELHFFGSGLKEKISPYCDATLATRIFFHGRVEHHVAIKRMHEASLLVNFASEGCSGILPSKIFEYAATGRPLISIPSDGDLIDYFIHASGTGYCASTVDQTAECLHSVYDEWRKTRQTCQPNRNETYLNKFDRRRLAQNFANIAEYCANG